MRTFKFSIFGQTFPIHRWTIWFFSVFAIVGTGGLIYKQFYPDDLVTLQEANHALSVEIQEYGRHLADIPRQAFDADDLTVRIYPDRCLLIQRKSPTGMLTKLVPDLERKDFKHRPGDEVPSNQSWIPSLVVPLEASVQGRCLNPHPGNFQTTYGRRDGCWIEVWRQWQDSCTHVQMFNTCSGGWDSHPNGSPRLRWTLCRH